MVASSSRGQRSAGAESTRHANGSADSSRSSRLRQDISSAPRTKHDSASGCRWQHVRAPPGGRIRRQRKSNHYGGGKATLWHHLRPTARQHAPVIGPRSACAPPFVGWSARPVSRQLVTFEADNGREPSRACQASVRAPACPVLSVWPTTLGGLLLPEASGAAAAAPPAAGRENATYFLRFCVRARDQVQQSHGENMMAKKLGRKRKDALGE